MSGGAANIKTDTSSMVDTISGALDSATGPVITFAPTDYCAKYLTMWVPVSVWRHAVAYAARTCGVILLLPEDSAGVADEIKWITSARHLTKLVVVVPPEYISGLRTNWEKLRKRWQKDGFRLPEYQRDGLVYTPNADLSINRSCSLEGRMDNVGAAVNVLRPNASDYLPLGTLVSYSIDLWPRSTVERFRRLTTVGVDSGVPFADPDPMTAIEQQHFHSYLSAISDGELAVVDATYAWIARTTPDSPRFTWYAKQTGRMCEERFGPQFRRAGLDAKEIQSFC